MTVDDDDEIKHALPSGRTLVMRKVHGELADVYLVLASPFKDVDGEEMRIYMTMPDVRAIWEHLAPNFVGRIVLHNVATEEDYTYEEVYSKMLGLAGPAYRHLDRIIDAALAASPAVIQEIRQALERAQTFLSQLVVKVRTL